MEIKIIIKMTNAWIIERLQKFNWKAIKGTSGIWSIINDKNLHIVSSTSLAAAYNHIKDKLKQ